jgi:hypothetical protein
MRNVAIVAEEHKDYEAPNYDCQFLTPSFANRFSIVTLCPVTQRAERKQPAAKPSRLKRS